MSNSIGTRFDNIKCIHGINVFTEGVCKNCVYLENLETKAKEYKECYLLVKESNTLYKEVIEELKEKIKRLEIPEPINHM